MNDMIRQRHLRDGFLKAQGTSTFAIVNHTEESSYLELYLYLSIFCIPLIGK